MFIHGVYVNMIPRMAVMVSGKVSSGLLQPVCRTLHVLMLAMALSILYWIWLTARLQVLSSGWRGRFAGFLLGVIMPSPV